MSTQTTTSGERAALLAMARDLARHELLARSVDLDRGDREAIAECWRSLVGVGLDRALLGERHGGVELSVRDLLAALEELAVGDGGIAMCVLLCNTALATLTDEQLSEIPWGARWALVPATSGTEVTVSDGALDGRIECALGALGAHGLVVILDGPEPAAFAIDAGAAGSRLERDVTQMGLRAAPAALIELADIDCPCPAGRAPALDGSDCSNGMMSAANARALLRAGTAAIANGIARRAHEMALEYAHARQQGGVAIIEHDAVSDMLSAMAVRLACRPEVGAGRFGSDMTADPLGLAIDQKYALAVKIAATDAAVATTTDAVQVFGGTGYMVETGVEKLMRDAKYCQLFPEPNWVAHDELMRSERAGLRSGEPEQ